MLTTITINSVTFIQILEKAILQEKVKNQGEEKHKCKKRFTEKGTKRRKKEKEVQVKEVQKQKMKCWKPR